MFLKLGVIGFGGPAAHIAMMREEVVRRRWVDDAEFAELVGATNIIPGPNSTELAIHLGQRQSGWRGLVVAGVCFIGPAVVIVSFLAWLYDAYGTRPAAVDLRYGILPVIIAVVANALIQLARTAVRGWLGSAIAAGAVAAYLFQVHELLILGVGGALAAVWSARRRPRRAGLLSLFPVLGVAHSDVRLGRLFLVFLEIGSVLYGSGYVLLAFLQRNLVHGLGWLTDQQLLDAIAVGQITPGPVFTTATFIGWQLDGPLGALVATVGIFLPSFVFVAALGRILPWVRSHGVAKAALAGVTAASLGLMAGVLVRLVGDAVIDVPTGVVAGAATVVLLTVRRSAAWLVGAGLIVGLMHLWLA